MTGTSLVVQWLRLHAPNAGNTGSSPSQGTKIQHVPWHSLKNISSNAFLEICYHRNAGIKKCIRDYSFLFYFVENICRLRNSLISSLYILQNSPVNTSPNGIFYWKYFHYKFSLFNRFNTIQVMYFFLSDFRQFASLKNCSISSKLSPLLAAQSCSQKILCCAQSLTCVQLFAIPWTVAHQALLCP